MFKLYFAIVFLSLFIVFIQHAVRVVYFMGFHVTVYNNYPGPCHLVPGVEEGSEDMETLPDGRTFITSGLLWSLSSNIFKKYYKDSGRKGRILYFDFKTPESGVTELKFDPGFDPTTFHPHGISVYENDGTITLFVVNHYPGFDKIEKFEFIEEKMMLQHKMSYVDEAIRIVNDVAATSENSFYFTNYAYARDHFNFLIEFGLFLPFGNAVYYDGASYEVVAESLVIPNGITVSKDQKNVYLAHGLFMTVNIYKREYNDSLSLLQEFPIYSGPDNILIEPESGNLIIGTHPAAYQVIDYMDNPSIPSPSKIVGTRTRSYYVKSPYPTRPSVSLDKSFQKILERSDPLYQQSMVLMVNMINGSYADGIIELYSEDGAIMSASTVASIYDNKMLVGSILSHLMYCEIQYMPVYRPKPKE